MLLSGLFRLLLGWTSDAPCPCRQTVWSIPLSSRWMKCFCLSITVLALVTVKKSCRNSWGCSRSSSQLLQHPVLSHSASFELWMSFTLPRLPLDWSCLLVSQWSQHPPTSSPSSSLYSPHSRFPYPLLCSWLYQWLSCRGLWFSYLLFTVLCLQPP